MDMLRVVVTDEDGTVLDSWEVERPNLDAPARSVAREAVVALAEEFAGGVR